MAVLTFDYMHISLSFLQPGIGWMRSYEFD